MSYVNLGSAASTGAAGLQKAFTILAQANADVARLLRPFHGAIDKLPYPATDRFKAMLKEKPLDALVEWVTPFEDIIKDTVTLANQLSNKPVRRIGAPPFRVDVDMRWEWPDDARITDYSLRVFVQRLRTINNLIVLSIVDPGHLAPAFAQTIVKYAKKEVEHAVSALVSAGQSVGQKAQETAQSFFSQFPSLGRAGGGLGAAWFAALIPQGSAVGGMSLSSLPAWGSVTKTLGDIAGLLTTPAVAVAIIGLLAACVGAGAPVAQAAIKAQQQQGQKNPYTASDPKVAEAERTLMVQSASAAAKPGVPMWAIGVGALAVGALLWRKK